MGIDLRLLPVDRAWSNGTAGYCHTILNCPQDYELFEDIRRISPDRLPALHQFTSHMAQRGADGEPTYGKLDRDPYGELYTWIRADVIGPILWKHHAAHPVSSYITSLPGDTMVVLDWH